MFCHNCGKKAVGKFCVHCGTEIVGKSASGIVSSSSVPDTSVTPDKSITPVTNTTPAVENTNTQLAAQWTEVQNYDQLIHHPDVRTMIAKYARESKTPVTAEEFMKLVDLAYKPLVGISLSTLNEVVLPIYSKMGLNSKKQVTDLLSQPLVHTVVRALCSLAKNGFPLSSTEPASNGVVICANIPSTIYSQKGELIITIEDHNLHTKVTVGSKIKGQIYDWGRNKKVIKKIMDDLHTLPLQV